jgi:hypothetical protein
MNRYRRRCPPRRCCKPRLANPAFLLEVEAIAVLPPA